MKYLFAIGILIACLIKIEGQTTYTSSPAEGIYTSCPSNTVNEFCPDGPFLGNTIQFSLYNITSTHFIFRLQKCTGTFGQGGTGYIKENGVCGDNPVPGNYNSGDSYFDISVSIPSGFNSGSKNYYATINAGSGDRFWGGVVIVTANTPQPEINITNPNGGSYDIGCSMNIQWTSSNTGPVSIELVQASDNSTVAVLVDPTTNDGTFGWTVGTNENDQYPGIPSGSYKIKMYETGTNQGVDYSSSFTITNPNITITNPNGGETYAVGGALPISWNSDNFCGNVSIELVNASNVNVRTIADPTSNDGAYNWTISGVSPGAYKIKIYKTVASGSSPAVDYSNNLFSITNSGAPFLQLNQAMSVTPTSPVTNENAMMEAVIKNNGNASWTGSLAFQLINLSEGASTDMITPVFVTLAPNETQTLIRPDGPIASLPGDYQIRVQYQTDGENTWTNVDPGTYLNPLPFIIQAQSSATLQLNAPISVTKPLIHTYPATFSADVTSQGGTWSGNLAMHIVVGGSEIDLVREDGVMINNNAVYNLFHSSANINTSPGTYNVFVVAQTNGTGAWFPVNSGSFQNPLSVTIESPPGAIELVSPNGGETFEVGQTLPVSWTTNGNIGNISIELESYPYDPEDKFVIADDVSNVSPYNSYTIPVCAKGQYRVKIYETNNGPATVDYSQSAFTIDLNSSLYNISLTSLNGGQNVNAGDPYPTINWNSTGDIGNISIELITAEGDTKAIIADGAPNTGSFTPTPGDNFEDNFPDNIPQGEYKIKIYNTGCGTVVDFSDNTFSINSNFSGSCSCTIQNPSPAQAEAYEAVSYLCEHCIIDSPIEPDFSVNPTELIIKEDLAKITFLALFGGDQTTATYADDFPTPFFDMPPTAPYQRFGKVLSYLEYGDGISPFNRRFANYRPGSPITRGQVCKVYCEAFNIECDALNEPFVDVDQDDPEFKYIAELVERGLINTNGAYFRPDDYATREEAFILLHRILAECGNCLDDALLASQATTIGIADSAFFDPGNYTPENLGRRPGFSDANFDSYSATGFYIADRGLPLVFGHSYNSYLTELSDEFFPQRPLGNGWAHTYNAYIAKIPNSYTTGYGGDALAVVWPDGSIHAYKDDGNLHPEKISVGNYDEITWNVGGDYYTIKKKNQVVFKFEKINGADNAPYMLTEIRDRNNNFIALTYQVHNYNDQLLARLAEVNGVTGRKLTFSYYGNSDKIQYVNDLSLGRSLEFYQGNPNNLDTRLLWYKDAEQRQTDYNYDDSSPDGYYLLKKITLPNGNFITNNYYEKKLTASAINDVAANNVVQTKVDWGLNNGAGGSSSTVSIYDGANTRDYTYTTNDLGKITHIDAPTNDADVVYGDTNNPTLPTSISVAGFTTTYEYDMTGNVTDVHQELGVNHHFEYNSNNDITLYTNPRGKTTTFVYGDGKNLSAVNAPIGSTTMTYYPYGLVQTVTNPEGVTVSYEYDNHGNIDKMTAPEGVSSSAIYDSGSRLEKFYNPNDQKVAYEYDDRNFITKVTNFLPNHPQYQQVSTQYDYDGNGNLTEITNARGHITQMEYDYFDLLRRETFGTATRSYEYDVEGKLTKITKADGMELIYNYLQTNGLLESDGYATYTYDSKYRMKTVSKDGKAISFNYDNLNRITSTVYDGQTVQYAYDLNSNVEKIIYPGGNEVDYTYDDNDRMKTVTDWNNNTTTYFYLDDGRMDRTEYPNGVVTQYTYDAAGRITGVATEKSGTTICAYNFTLDKLGNHLEESKTEPFAYSNWPDVSETDYSYNNRNEIQTGGGKTFTHDNNGNIINIGGARNWTLNWDKHDMLTSVSGDFAATYVYDGLGHRRQATRDAVTTKYVLDILGMSRILIEEDVGGVDQHYYVYGLGMISRVKPNGETRYYHYDFRGSTVAMTDETGAITHQYAYDEYGATLQEQEEDFNPFRFVGGFGVMQENSNLLFMRARYYDVEIGRFLSEDPVWSDNLYAYGGENPLRFIDPKGLSDWQTNSISAYTLTGDLGQIDLAYGSYIADVSSDKIALGGEGSFYHMEGGPLEIDVGKIGGSVEFSANVSGIGFEAGFEACAIEAEANLVCTPFGSLKGGAGLCGNAKIMASSKRVGAKIGPGSAYLDLTEQCYDVEILDIGYDDVAAAYNEVKSEIQPYTNSRFGGIKFINDFTRFVTGRSLRFNTLGW